MKYDLKDNLPTKGIWLRFLLLIPLAAILTVATFLHVGAVSNTYRMWTPVELTDRADFSSMDIDGLEIDPPDVVKATKVEHYPTGAACVTFDAVSDGETTVKYKDPQLTELKKWGTDTIEWNFRVVNGAIVEGVANFSGWETVLLCVCIFLFAIAVLFASVLVRLVRASWYGYHMVAAGGGLVFTLFQAILFLLLYVRRSLLNLTEVAIMLSRMTDLFLWVSLLPMGLLALLVSLSNISLIRHEGKRPVNLLGIAVSVVWALANFLWFHLWNLGLDLPVPNEALAVVETFIGVGIAFGECLLLSTIVCAWLASRHVPNHGADYLVVLGCGILPDGTPSPLLAQRVDRARDFDATRVKAGDAPTTFVPSGGQGPDEPMSEAQSMRDYLVKQGVKDERIVMENRSATTRENMAFSREVIEQHAKRDVSDVTVAFSTTNYHVFRGYVCAHQVGMIAEGMGSKTRAYFWPNAFLREFAGLLAAQWRGILQTYLILAIIYVIAQYIVILA